MTRIKGWRSALHEEIERHRRIPFSFGHDCALFAADCVQAMTGQDLAAAFRGHYTTQAGALRLLSRHGFASLADLAGSMLEEIHPVRAAVGDVAFIADDSPFGGALGIVIGEQAAVMHERGVGSLPRSMMTKAFRVP